MTSNPAYPPYPPSNQPPYPSTQPLSPYPPPNQGGMYYPPPVETMPPPPSYENAVSGGKPAQSQPYNYSYQAQPVVPPVTTVPYGNSNFDERASYIQDAIISFDDKSIRLGFIRRVFGILMLQLLTTVGTICLFIFSDTVRNAVQNNWGVYISAYVLFLALYFVLLCCDGVRRNYPSNLILLVLFTLSLSYLVGVISSFHSTNIVLIMMGVTTLVCASVMIFACQTKYDFTTWGGVLFCASLALLFMGIFTPLWLLLNTTVGKIFIGGGLALLFAAFLAYDVQLVMGGKKYELSPEEHIFASLVLYMDIIRIFLLLLLLFGGRGNN